MGVSETQTDEPHTDRRIYRQPLCYCSEKPECAPNSVRVRQWSVRSARLMDAGERGETNVYRTSIVETCLVLLDNIVHGNAARSKLSSCGCTVAQREGDNDRQELGERAFKGALPKCKAMACTGNKAQSTTLGEAWRGTESMAHAPSFKQRRQNSTRTFHRKTAQCLFVCLFYCFIAHALFVLLLHSFTLQQ